MSSHPPPCYPPGRALESSNPPTAPSPAIAGAAPDRTSLSAGWVSGTWALWRGQGGILTLSLWMTSSSFQKPTGPSYLGSPCPDWEMCRKQGLKTTWKNWPGQGARKKCQSEQGCWEVRRQNRRRGQQGRKKGGREGRRQGGRAKALGGVGVKDQQAFVCCWEHQTPGSLLPVSSTPELSCALPSLSAAAGAQSDIKCT